MRLLRVEQVEVAGAEDGGVEDLRDQGHALGRPIAMDGKYQDELRENVGDVSQIAEELLRVSLLLGADPSTVGDGLGRERRTFHMVAGGGLSNSQIKATESS